VTAVLIDQIGELVTNSPAHGTGLLGRLADAALVLDGPAVAWVGPAGAAPAADSRVDAAGAAVLPGFVDSHAHLVFAGDRAKEFAARRAGQPYTAGGIRATVAATRSASDATLRANLRRLAVEALAQGATTIECKSGYGLTVADEARSLALAREATPEVTFLGAHVVPAEFAADRLRRAGLHRHARRRSPAPPLDRRVLRDRRLRRRRHPAAGRGPFAGERLASVVHFGNGKDAELLLTFAGGPRVTLRSPRVARKNCPGW
jgi:imidazolonepropionase-like amidohydrolase